MSAKIEQIGNDYQSMGALLAVEELSQGEINDVAGGMRAVWTWDCSNEGGTTTCNGSKDWID